MYECIATCEPIPPTLCAASDDVYQRRPAATAAAKSANKSDANGLLTDRLKELDAERKELGTYGWHIYAFGIGSIY